MATAAARPRPGSTPAPPGRSPDGLVDEPGLADAGRTADQQDAAGRLVLGGQVSDQGAELRAPADERDTRRDGGHALSIAQACVLGFSTEVQ